jgi:hypothetical protein
MDRVRGEIRTKKLQNKSDKYSVSSNFLDVLSLSLLLPQLSSFYTIPTGDYVGKVECLEKTDKMLRSEDRTPECLHYSSEAKLSTPSTVSVGVESKVKLSLCLIKHHPIKTCEAWRHTSTITFLSLKCHREKGTLKD